MLKSIAFSIGISTAAAWSAVYDGHEDFAHDAVWGHDHYEPGDVNRFNNHYAEIYGADDLAWGPNGYSNPLAAKDNQHNWDDQGDAYVCHSCGGHGCGLCGGYGHFHRNAQFGYHGHSLMNGFGVGHWHTYLGPKVRSSYNKYGHGIGGRYTQRWSNGYGDRYGINAGERYGLNHRWGIYNGIGKGNPSSKGSNLGYGIGSNAEVPTLVDLGDHDYDYGYYGDEDYGYDQHDYGYDDDYSYDQDEDSWASYEEPAEESYEEEAYPEEDYHWDDYGYDYYPEDDYYGPEDYYTDFAAGYGLYPSDGPTNAVGEGTLFTYNFGLGHGNHSPWHQEAHRSDRGIYSVYRQRPTEVTVFHTPPGYYNN